MLGVLLLALVESGAAADGSHPWLDKQLAKQKVFNVPQASRPFGDPPMPL